MRDAGENHIGLELAHQAEQANRTGANPGCAEGMHRDPGWQTDAVGAGTRDQTEMDIVFLLRQASSQERSDLLGPAAAQVRDEQEDSDSIRYGIFRRDR